MNPTVPDAFITTAYVADAAVAAAEYGAEFRSDVESFLPPEAIDATVIPNRRELPPVPAGRYVAFVDPSGGSGDSFTVAVAHRQDDRGVLDAVREVKPPFSPAAVVEEFAGLLRRYGISRVTGDRYAGEWPPEQFRQHGIAYQPSERTKSEIYQEVLPPVKSGRVELLDHDRLKTQLLGLERRTARGGRDSIDHAPGGHDDVANAAAGALVLALHQHDWLNDAAIWAINDRLRRPSPGRHLDPDFVGRNRRSGSYVSTRDPDYEDEDELRRQGVDVETYRMY